MKVTKRKKSSRMHGRKMGTHGWGARKKHKKTGHRGGKGMSGSGKRADHKKTLVIKLYGGKYFGKQGITSKGTQKDKSNRINLGTIEKNLEKYGKKTSKGFEINLSSYKILGTGDTKNKLIIKANDSSKSARKKVEAKGGEIILIHSPKSQTKTGGEIILPNKKEIVLKKKQQVGSSQNVVASLKETKDKEKK